MFTQSCFSSALSAHFTPGQAVHLSAAQWSMQSHSLQSRHPLDSLPSAFPFISENEDVHGAWQSGRVKELIPGTLRDCH